MNAIALNFLLLSALLVNSACSLNSAGNRLVLDGVGNSGSCQASDARCIQHKTENACFKLEEARDPVDACLCWLQELEKEAEIGGEQGLYEPEILLAIAATNYRLGEFPSWRSLVSQADRFLGFEKYHLEALRLYQVVHQNSPRHVDAMYGLVVFADSDEEKLDWLRKIVAVRPENISCRFLENALSRVHGHSDQEHWAGEVNRCQRRAN